MVIRLGMMQHTITGWLPQLYYVHSIRLDISVYLSHQNCEFGIPTMVEEIFGGVLTTQKLGAQSAKLRKIKCESGLSSVIDSKPIL